MNKTKQITMPMLGRSEVIHFIDVAIHDVPAKIDTGAYRSAIHASNIRLSPDGKQLSFDLLGGHPVFGKYSKTIQTDTFKQVEVENSFGHRETRYEVDFEITMGDTTCVTGFTLADRKNKAFPVLIGRTLLNKRFIVDTSKFNVRRAELKAALLEAQAKGMSED